MSRESNRGWYAVAIPACAICALLSIAMFIHLAVYIIKRRSEWQSKSTVILMVGCCCLSMFGCIIETLRFLWAFLAAPDNLLHNKWVNIGDDFFHFGGQFLFYVFSLFRVKAIFSGTAFEVQKWLLVTFLVLISIQLAWNMWHVVNVIIAFFFMHATNEETLHNVMVIPVMLMCVYSFVVNSSLLTLFNLKSHQFIHGGSQADRKDDAAERRREFMLDVLIKCNMLFGAAIVTNELFYVSLIVNKYTEFHGWYVFLARCLENFSNISAAYLSHRAAKPVYERVCGLCHRCIKNSQSNKARQAERMLSMSVTSATNNASLPSMQSAATCSNSPTPNSHSLA